MASEHAVIIEESLRIPADALTFEGFRRWAQSEEFPETGRIDYLAGDVEVDMSPEDLHTHGIVKVAITAGLHALVAERELGEIFLDRTRITSPLAELSAEPDVVVVLWESLQAGRVRYLPAASKEPDRYTEIEGAPDVVDEVVSDSSVRKDTKRLLQNGEYVSRVPDAEGWLWSERLAVFVRLSRRKTPISTWGYRLEHRED